MNQQLSHRIITVLLLQHGLILSIFRSGLLRLTMNCNCFGTRMKGIGSQLLALNDLLLSDFWLLSAEYSLTPCGLLNRALLLRQMAHEFFGVNSDAAQALLVPLLELVRLV